MPAIRGRTLSTWGGLFTPVGLSGSTPFTGIILAVLGSVDTLLLVTGSVARVLAVLGAADTFINVTGSL